MLVDFLGSLASRLRTDKTRISALGHVSHYILFWRRFNNFLAFRTNRIAVLVQFLTSGPASVHIVHDLAVTTRRSLGRLGVNTDRILRGQQSLGAENGGVVLVFHVTVSSLTLLPDARRRIMDVLDGLFRTGDVVESGTLNRRHAERWRMRPDNAVKIAFSEAHALRDVIANVMHFFPNRHFILPFKISIR